MLLQSCLQTTFSDGLNYPLGVLPSCPVCKGTDGKYPSASNNFSY